MAYNSTHTGMQIDAAINTINTAIPITNGGTGANTLQGAQDALGITELNSKIGDYGDYDAFFELVQSNTSHTVPNVNQYRYILVCMLWKESNGTINLLVSHTLPLGVFKTLTTNGNGIQAETHDSSRHFAHLYLTSDTSMHIDAGSGMTSNFAFSVYGIK